MDIKNYTNSVLPGRSNDSVKALSKDVDGGTKPTAPNKHVDKVILTDVLSQARELETKSRDV